jgi:DNA-binding cell septation regulator SpoVG
MMKITKVKVYPYKNKSRTGAVGVGLIVLEHQLLLSGLELYERNEKRFVKFPKNEFNKHDLCYCQPTSQAFNSLITNALFKAYDETFKNRVADNNNDNYFKAAAAEMFQDWQKQTLETAANNLDICAQAVGESTEFDKHDIPYQNTGIYDKLEVIDEDNFKNAESGKLIKEN